MIEATLCYINNHNKTLMMHRIKKKNDIHANKWSGVGGKFNEGESPEECAIREIKEETGFDINNVKMKGVLTFPKFDGKNDWLVFVFTAETKEYDFIQTHEGVLHWVETNKVLELNLWEGDKIFIPLLYQKKFFSAKFIYEKGKLISHKIVFYE
jgi:8-oxo-dGTP diphosphatase